MIVELTVDECDFVNEQSNIRVARKRGEGRVSHHNVSKLTFMGIAGEFAIAKLLGCHFNPFYHRGGDGHRRDLWRGPVTLAVKTRHGHLPADFLFPPHQMPAEGGFPDDFGVVGLWKRNYWQLDVVGYFTRADFLVHATQITVGGTRSGTPEARVGYPHTLLRPIEELENLLEQVPDETILPYSDCGYIRSLWNGHGSGGS